MEDEKIMELALIENVQRDDLTPIEEARAYELLQTRYGYTQEKLSERMGKSRSFIANSTRLLSLPEDVQDMLQDGKLSTGHLHSSYYASRETFAKHILRTNTHAKRK